MECVCQWAPWVSGCSLITVWISPPHQSLDWTPISSVACLTPPHYSLYWVAWPLLCHNTVRSNRIATHTLSRAITAGAHSPTSQRLIVKATSCILMENLAQDIFLFVHVQSKPGLSWVSSRTAWFYVTVNVLTVGFLWVLRLLYAYEKHVSHTSCSEPVSYS